jgi:hypothetical protein
MQHFLCNTSHEDVIELCQFTKIMLDGTGAPALARRSNDHLLTVELRRLGRFLDIRKDKNRPKLPIATIYTLQLLEQSHDMLSVSQLSQILGKDQANISRIVKSLVERFLNDLKRSKD